MMSIVTPNGLAVQLELCQPTSAVQLAISLTSRVERLARIKQH